jgi:hypothetical protein
MYAHTYACCTLEYRDAIPFTNDRRPIDEHGKPAFIDEDRCKASVSRYLQVVRIDEP